MGFDLFIIVHVPYDHSKILAFLTTRAGIVILIFKIGTVTGTIRLKDSSLTQLYTWTDATAEGVYCTI